MRIGLWLYARRAFKALKFTRAKKGDLQKLEFEGVTYRRVDEVGQGASSFATKATFEILDPSVVGVITPLFANPSERQVSA